MAQGLLARDWKQQQQQQQRTGPHTIQKKVSRICHSERSEESALTVDGSATRQPVASVQQSNYPTQAKRGLEWATHAPVWHGRPRPCARDCKIPHNKGAGPVFDLWCTIKTAGAPSFSHFAKGGSGNVSIMERLKSCVGTIASRPFDFAQRQAPAKNTRTGHPEGCYGKGNQKQRVARPPALSV